ncbi:MAG TPA: hypothetical protein VIO61_15190 [Anaerolineaceae bacterium]
MDDGGAGGKQQAGGQGFLANIFIDAAVAVIIAVVVGFLIHGEVVIVVHAGGLVLAEILGSRAGAFHILIDVRVAVVIEVVVDLFVDLAVAVVIKVAVVVDPAVLLGEGAVGSAHVLVDQPVFVIIDLVGQFLVDLAVLIVIPARGVADAANLGRQADCLRVRLTGVIGGGILAVGDAVAIAVIDHVAEQPDQGASQFLGGAFGVEDLPAGAGGEPLCQAGGAGVGACAQHDRDAHLVGFGGGDGGDDDVLVVAWGIAGVAVFGSLVGHRDNQAGGAGFPGVGARKIAHCWSPIFFVVDRAALDRAADGAGGAHAGGVDAQDAVGDGDTLGFHLVDNAGDVAAKRREIVIHRGRGVHHEQDLDRGSSGCIGRCCRRPAGRKAQPADQGDANQDIEQEAYGFHIATRGI